MIRIKELSLLFSKILILLTIFALLLTGCGTSDNKYTEGGWYNNRFSSPVALKSSTNVFSIDNVNLNVYFGFYDLDEDHNPKGTYLYSNYKNVLFVVYICACYVNGYYNCIPFRNAIVDDYKNLDNHIFIREISEEEAFSEEYGYTVNWRNRITYNHNEIIHIPSDCFNLDRGTLHICVAPFNPTEEGTYYWCYAPSMQISYQKLDENTVMFHFKDKMISCQSNKIITEKDTSSTE